MQYRPYGATGKDVSVLAMGGMRFANPDDIDAMAEIPLYLYDQGVNYFDTAPIYCRDKSEEILGTAVQQMKKRVADGGREFYVTSKTTKDTPAGVREELERSLKRIGVDCIDFYHIWCLRTWEEWEQRKRGGAVEEFHKLKDEGLIRHVVCSHHMDSADTERLIADAQVEGMLLGYNAANFLYRQDGIRTAAAKNWGVMVMNPLGGGLFWQAPEKFEFLKTREGDDFVRGALRFVLSHPEITGALVGVRSLEDARQAVEAVESMALMPQEELEAFKGAIRENFPDLCTGCGYCRECPVDIPVDKLMETCNQVMLGSPQAVWGRLKWHWGVEDVDELVDACVECGRCEELCTQHLPIRERLKTVKAAWLESKPKG